MNAHSKKFFGGLESLRGIAALMVVFCHMSWPNPLTRHLFFYNGYLMVDLFFVLSGFVICHNYGRSIASTRDINRLMFLRFGRLYPLHLFVLLAFLGIETLKCIGEIKFGYVPHQSRAFSENNSAAFIANLLLIQPFFESTNKSFNAASWSIGVEFYTYLVFAFVLLIATNKRRLCLISFLLVLLTLSLLILCGDGLTTKASWCFGSCVLGFFIGVLVYQIYDSDHQLIPPQLNEVTIACALIVLGGLLSLKESPALDFAALPIFAVLVLTVASAPEESGMISKALNSQSLRWLGATSYSIYMVHPVVLLLMIRICTFWQGKLSPYLVQWVGLMFVFLGIILTLFVAQFTYKWIEKPFQKEFRNLGAKIFIN